jgi:hypothetical protein
MLTDIRKQTPVSSIGDVLSIMTAIDSCLPDSDGLKWFNRLYMQVTRSIKQAVNPPAFRDTRFMSELDVVFANLYSRPSPPGMWIPRVHHPRGVRFCVRGRTAGLPVCKFALAGMNAHINRDLPQGIVQVFEAIGGDPTIPPRTTHGVRISTA